MTRIVPQEDLLTLEIQMVENTIRSLLENTIRSLLSRVSPIMDLRSIMSTSDVVFKGIRSTQSPVSRHFYSFLSALEKQDDDVAPTGLWPGFPVLLS